MRISYLKIFSEEIEEQKEFYSKILGLKVTALSKEAFRVEMGYSVLEIAYSQSATPYHIAFHIPAYREEQALAWLKQRVEILKSDGNEIIDFSGWKAKSLYFYDAGKNILEFISRRHFFPATSEGFSRDHIVGISEIGLATANVKQAFDFLNANFGLEKFTGDYEHFCATGNDEGLFIVINKDQKEWIPVGDKAWASPFEIRILVDGAAFRAAYNNERLELL